MHERCRQFIIDIVPMKKTQVLTFLSILFLVSCSTDSRDTTSVDDSSLKYDTSKTAILSWDRNSRFPFNNVDYDAAILIQDDIHVIDSLLLSTVMNYNNSLTDKYD